VNKCLDLIAAYSEIQPIISSSSTALCWGLSLQSDLTSYKYINHGDIQMEGKCNFCNFFGGGKIQLLKLWSTVV